jgi:hypothetical protein
VVLDQAEHSMKWLFVGCNLNDVPKEILLDKHKSVEEIRQILQNVPIKEGSADADSIEELTKILMKNGIYPLKIKKANKRDYMLDSLRLMQKLIQEKIHPKQKIKHTNKLFDTAPPNKILLFYQQIFAMILTILVVICILVLWSTHLKNSIKNNTNQEKTILEKMN